MTASTFAAAISLDAGLFEREPQYGEAARRRMRAQIGDAIVEFAEQSKSPVAFELKWQAHTEPSDWDWRYRLILTARIMPVEVIQMTMPLLEPAEWTYARLDRTAHIPIEWQCGYCGQVNLLDQHLECRKCGAPRKVMR